MEHRNDFAKLSLKDRPEDMTVDQLSKNALNILNDSNQIKNFAEGFALNERGILFKNAGFFSYEFIENIEYAQLGISKVEILQKGDIYPLRFAMKDQKTCEDFVENLHLYFLWKDKQTSS